MYKLTEQGRQRCEQFIAECNAKRKEILDAGRDTADDTPVLTTEAIEQDLEGFVDEVGDYYNYWGVTDNYNSDRGIGLILGIDFIEVAEQTLHNEDKRGIRKNAYELYKIDWEHDHGISGARKLEAYRNYVSINNESGCYASFEDYLDDVGYSGELYVCYDEFLGAEYMDAEYMRYLLAEPELVNAYRFDLMKSAMELAGWQLTEVEGERTVWQFAPTGNADGLPFPEVENQQPPVEPVNTFSVVKYSFDELQEYLEDIVPGAEVEDAFNQLLSAAEQSVAMNSKKRGGR